MKKYLFAIFAVMAIFPEIIMAGDLNSTQLRLRTEIKTFLQEEGYMPEIDSDGDIKFKKEGGTYYVRVDSKDDSPMYVALFKNFNNPNGYTKEQIQLASCEMNLFKGIKCICFDNSFSLRAEMYVVSSDSFKYSFSKVMKQISNAEDEFMDDLKSVNISGGSGSAFSSYIPFLVTELEVANTDENNEIIQDFGSTIYDYKTKYLSPRITVIPTKTGEFTINIKLFKDGVLKEGSKVKGFSYSSKVNINSLSSHTFKLSGWGGSDAGHWSMGDYRFEIWYDGYCLGSYDFRVY